MSRDFRYFLLCFSIGLVAGYATYRVFLSKDPYGAVGIGLLSIMPFAFIAHLAICIIAGTMNGTIGIIDVVRTVLTGNERMKCRNCGNVFSSSEAGNGYNGSRHDPCLTCPRCHHWVRDL